MAVKYNCGTILPTSCLPFTGSDLTFLQYLTLEADRTLSCDARADDVFQKFNLGLTKLFAGLDFSGLDKDCLDFVPATVTSAELHQLEIDQICLNKSAIETLTTRFDEWVIGNELVTVVLPDCLAPTVSVCETPENQYQLKTLLLLYATKICELEQRISDLE